MDGERHWNFVQHCCYRKTLRKIPGRPQYRRAEAEPIGRLRFSFVVVEVERRACACVRFAPRTGECKANVVTLSLVTVGQLPWDDIKILEPRAGHLISKF